MELTTGQKIVSETSVSNCCLSPVLEWCVVDDSTHTIGLKRMCAECKSEYIHLVEKSVLEQLLAEAERRAVERYKQMTFCNGVGKIHTFKLISEGRDNGDYYQVQECELCGFIRKTYGDRIEQLSQLRKEDKLNEESDETD